VADFFSAVHVQNGDIPPTAAEMRYYGAQQEVAMASCLKLISLLQTQGNSPSSLSSPSCCQDQRNLRPEPMA
jgi:hypothetical protein